MADLRPSKLFAIISAEFAGGFEPVPIISSRRIRSEIDLNTLIDQLNVAAHPSRFMFVGGDPAMPAGPYQDSLALLASGVLQRHGIRNVGDSELKYLVI